MVARILEKGALTTRQLHEAVPVKNTVGLAAVKLLGDDPRVTANSELVSTPAGRRRAIVWRPTS